MKSFWHRAFLTAIRSAKTIVYTILVVLVTIVIVQAIAARKKPDLQLWHTIVLENEFHRDSPDKSMREYFAREDRLFRELKQRVFDVVKAQGPDTLNRFNPNSRAFPARFGSNWNRSYEIETANPRGAVVLLHGLSDSPYSLRAVGEHFSAKGFYVLGLRTPGHGTTPSSLTDVSWEDWDAAVQLATIYAREKVGPKKPLFLAGYSTGSALAVEYSLKALRDPQLPRPDGLFLFSPAIGVSKLAFLAKWQLLLSELPGLEKMGWLDLYPEYDPFKYNSFPTRAGYEIYRLTRELSQGLQRAAREGLTKQLPPMVAYSSVVDATVSIAATVKQLFAILPENGSELVLFDLNRKAEAQLFVDPKYDSALKTFLARKDRPYSVTLLTNRASQSKQLIAKSKRPHSSNWSTEKTGLVWPRGIYSLSHVAIPFSPNDPVYGNGRGTDFSLGAIEARGERGVLTAPLSLFMRLRYNPFFSYIETNIDRNIDAWMENKSAQGPLSREARAGSRSKPTPEDSTGQ